MKNQNVIIIETCDNMRAYTSKQVYIHYIKEERIPKRFDEPKQNNNFISSIVKDKKNSHDLDMMDYQGQSKYYGNQKQNIKDFGLFYFYSKYNDIVYFFNLGNFFSVMCN